MRTPNIGSVFYAPSPVPGDVTDLPRYIEVEMVKIQAAIDLLAQGHLDKSYAAPSKPRDGDFRYADGTTWNPGSGIGFYRYNGSAWVFLG